MGGVLSSAPRGGPRHRPAPPEAPFKSLHGSSARAAVEPSGLTVLHHRQPARRTACAMVAVGVGSRDEEETEHGLAHFLEHLLFMGTRDFPGPIALSAALDAVGARHNAFTAMDHTCYHVTLVAERLPLALHILSQMMLHPQLEASILDKEREVVKQEIAKNQDDASAHVEVLAYLELFRDHPTLSHDVAGTPADMDAHRRAGVRRFWRKHYRLPNMALVVCAPQSYREVLALARRHFAPPGARGAAAAPRVPRPFVWSPAGLRKMKRVRNDIDQTHVCLLFPAPVGFVDRDRYVLQLLAHILGGYSSSRLWRRIREQNGWAYTVYAESYVMDEVSVIQLYMGLDARHTRAALRAAMSEIKDVARRGVRDDELKAACGHVEGALAMRMEDAHSAAWFWAEQLLYTRLRAPRPPPRLVPPMDVSEEVRMLRGVTAADVARVARRALRCRNATLMCVGPSAVRPPN